MAWLRNSGRTEPPGEEWAKTGNSSQGKEHSVINYSATLNKQSHVTSQGDRVFGFRLVTDDHQRLYGPPRIELFKNQGDVDYHSHFPQSMAYGSPKKAGEFSPKERLHAAPRNSAAHMKNSPFSREDDDDDDDDDDSSTDASDDDYDWQWGYGVSYPPKPVRTRPEHDTDYSSESPKGAGRKPSLVPPAGRHQQYPAPVSTSPKKDAHHETARNRPIGHSPPRSKPQTDTQSPEAGWKPLYEPPMGRHPQYSAPISTSPKKDMHYETAKYRPTRPGFPRSKPETDTDYAVEIPKYGRPSSSVPPAGKNPHYYAPDTTNNSPSVHSPLRSKPESQTGYASDSPKAGQHPSFDYPAGRKPHHTLPVKDSRYETAYNSKSAYDNGKGVTFENPKPKYAQLPKVEVGPQTRKEGHQQTIDSSEARKRYGGKAVNLPKREEKEYRGTIDCKEAARKYNGVFVP